MTLQLLHKQPLIIAQLFEKGYAKTYPWHTTFTAAIASGVVAGVGLLAPPPMQVAVLGFNVILYKRECGPMPNVIAAQPSSVP